MKMSPVPALLAAALLAIAAGGCGRSKPAPAAEAAAVPPPADPEVQDVILVEPVALDPRGHEGHGVDCPCLLLSAEALATRDGADLFDAWRAGAPGPAAAWLARLPASPAALEAVDRTVAAWADADPAAALDWAMAAANPAIRARALAGIAESWTGRGGQAAPLLERDTLGAGAGRDAAAERMAEAWARVDPVSASVWVGSFPTGMLREAAASKLVRLWSEHDPKSAEAWRAAHRP